MSSTLALAMIVGSVREGRFGPVVADWFVGQAKQRDDLSVDVIDLADTPIPSTNFSSRIGAADAFVMVTPEYNHGYPGPLKTAIDSVSRDGAPSRSASSATAACPADFARSSNCASRYARAAHPYGT